MAEYMTRRFTVLVLFLITCGLLVGTASAGLYDLVFPLTGGCSYNPCCEYNQSLCPFGGPCCERQITIFLGMTGSYFSATPTSGPAPLDVQFSANSGSLYATYSWDFGDGSYGSGMNPVHTYTVPGNYSVKLTVRIGQASVNYQIPSEVSWGQENTWLQEDMIQVTGEPAPVSTISSAVKEPSSPLTGIVQGATADNTARVLPYRTILYHQAGSGSNQPSVPYKGSYVTKAPVLTIRGHRSN